MPAELRELAELTPYRRSCGSCSACCKIMAVPDFEGKPNQHEWCRHARPGKGCAIYAERPEACQDFSCMWLLDVRFEDYWFPAKAKIVISPKLDGDNAYVAFIVDPTYPGRWRQEPWFGDIKKLAAAGLCGAQKWRTVVMIGDQTIPIGA